MALRNSEIEWQRFIICILMWTDRDKQKILHLPSGHCKYHPEPAQYDAGVLAGSTKPVGMFPCCGQNTLRFDPTQSNQVYCAFQFIGFQGKLFANVNTYL